MNSRQKEKRSVGHIGFIGPWEYYRRVSSQDISRADRTNPIMPDGYRCGRFESTAAGWTGNPLSKKFLTAHLATLESLSPAILSPVVQHYITIKQLHPGVLLLYRIGDFFEAFFEDAVTIADDLELKLTSKSMLTTKDAAKRLDDKRIPMTGFPYHAIKRYGALLLAHGYSVAICDLARELQVIRPEGNPEIPTPDDTPTITATLVKVFIDGTKEVDALIQDDTSLDGIEL